MNKGYTLIELLAAIVIISLISFIGIVSFKTFFDHSKENYYDTLESNILIAGNDYYLDHRDKLPTNDTASEISLGDLIDEKYIETIKDSEGNVCKEGKVFSYRENNKYVYEVCLLCDNYQSNGPYCKKYIVK